MTVIRDSIFSFDKNHLKLKSFWEDISCSYQPKLLSGWYNMWSKSFECIDISELKSKKQTLIINIICEQF